MRIDICCGIVWLLFAGGCVNRVSKSSAEPAPNEVNETSVVDKPPRRPNEMSSDRESLIDEILINEPPINKVCPRSGLPVSTDSLTKYRDYTVGFCNTRCRDDFAANIADRPNDCAAFDKIIADGIQGKQP